MRVLVFCLLIVSYASQAAIQTQKVSYSDEETHLNGYLFWDDAIKTKRPGIMLIHEWWGLDDYAKKRAYMLAELGFVAFAVDMYGDGHVTTRPEQAKEWMQEVTVDVELWQERAMLGLQQLKSSKWVDQSKLAAIGYCFGGSSVLQMSYANAPLKGVVAFHSGLPAAPEEVKNKIGPQILVLHGQADSFVAPEVVSNFRKKLELANADWEMNTYGGAKHGFTNPDAGKFGIPNLQYNESADKRSWARMQEFFKTIFNN